MQLLPLSQNVYIGFNKESLKALPLNKASPENKKETASARPFLQGHIVISDTKQSKCQNADLMYTA